uniref:Uncharacterized protein n=1 Tax=Anguilla anguilla TaxID=7936 RepID=A0A0E9TLF6_ANGAN
MTFLITDVSPSSRVALRGARPLVRACLGKQTGALIIEPEYDRSIANGGCDFEKDSACPYRGLSFAGERYSPSVFMSNDESGRLSSPIILPHKGLSAFV